GTAGPPFPQVVRPAADPHRTAAGDGAERGAAGPSVARRGRTGGQSGQCGRRDPQGAGRRSEDTAFYRDRVAPRLSLRGRRRGSPRGSGAGAARGAAVVAVVEGNDAAPLRRRERRRTPPPERYLAGRGQRFAR